MQVRGIRWGRGIIFRISSDNGIKTMTYRGNNDRFQWGGRGLGKGCNLGDKDGEAFLLALVRNESYAKPYIMANTTPKISHRSASGSLSGLSDC